MNIRNLVVLLVLLAVCSIPSFAEDRHGCPPPSHGAGESDCNECPNHHGGSMCSEQVRVQLNSIQHLLQKVSGNHSHDDVCAYFNKVNAIAKEIPLREGCMTMWSDFMINVSKCKFFLLQKDKAGVEASWSMLIDEFVFVYEKETGVKLNGSLDPVH